MKKEIIKCDKCGRVLDREIDQEYFELRRRDMPGWVSYIGTIHDFEVEKQICVDCLKKAGLSWEELRSKLEEVK